MQYLVTIPLCVETLCPLYLDITYFVLFLGSHIMWLLCFFVYLFNLCDICILMNDTLFLFFVITCIFITIFTHRLTSALSSPCVVSDKRYRGNVRESGTNASSIWLVNMGIRRRRDGSHPSHPYKPSAYP